MFNLSLPSRAKSMCNILAACMVPQRPQMDAMVTTSTRLEGQHPKHQCVCACACVCVG